MRGLGVTPPARDTTTRALGLILTASLAVVVVWAYVRQPQTLAEVAGGLIVDDPDLRMTSADELKAELDEGLRRDSSDFNPFNVFRPRK